MTELGTRLVSEQMKFLMKNDFCNYSFYCFFYPAVDFVFFDRYNGDEWDEDKRISARHEEVNETWLWNDF